MSNGYGYSDKRGQVIETLGWLEPGDEKLGAHLIDIYGLRSCEARADATDGWYGCGWEPQWRMVRQPWGEWTRRRTGCEHALYHRVDINGRRLTNRHDFGTVPDLTDTCRDCGIHYSDLFGDGSP